MTPTDPPDGLRNGDVNEAAVDDWKDQTTSFDRVRQVIDVTTEPQSAREIAERARVSPPTARKYLGAMVEVGRAKGIDTENGKRYMRSPQVIAMRRISAIHREHTRDEIRDAIQDLREQLADLRETYGVSDVDDLVVELEAGDDGWQDVARWQQLEENLDIAQAALALYDFDPDDSHSATTATRESPDHLTGNSRKQGSLGNSGSESFA